MVLWLSLWTKPFKLGGVAPKVALASNFECPTPIAKEGFFVTFSVCRSQLTKTGSSKEKVKLARNPSQDFHLKLKQTHRKIATQNSTEAKGQIATAPFVPYDYYDSMEGELRMLKKRYANLDAYFVKEYPLGHSKRFVTEFDKTEWRFLFSTDRRKREKGFVQIKF